MFTTVRAYLVSMLIHAGLVGGGMFLLGSMPDQSEAVVIDLSLMDISCRNNDTALPKDTQLLAAVRQPCPIVPHRVAPPKAPAEQRIVAQPEPPAAQQAASPVTAEVTQVEAHMTSYKIDRDTGGKQTHSLQGSATGTGSQNSVSRAAAGVSDLSGEQTLQEQYTKEHFAYIRRIINERIRYPRAARIRGQEGTVMVAFTIKKDGSIAAPQIVTGSGHTLLDENALQAIQNAAPFPRPPVMAQMRVPVVYRLTTP